MQYVIILILVGVLPILGFVVGSRIGKQANANLARFERKELERRRNFMADLSVRAAEHSVLGDDFAVIVTGMLADEKNRK